MPTVHKPFEIRIRKIQKRHLRLAQGYALKVDKNNLIVQQPRYLNLQFPWRALVVVIMVGLGFKGYLMVALDGPTYASKVDALSQGHPLEQAGAWVMQPDPASDAVARMIRMMHS